MESSWSSSSSKGGSDLAAFLVTTIASSNSGSSSSIGEDVNTSANSSSTMGVVDEGEDDELEGLNKRLLVYLLLVVYLLVIVGGVLGNGSILMTLFTSGRVPRNPLLVVLCLSDFFVSGLSAPITVITSAFVQNSWAAGPCTCMTMYFLQVRNGWANAN